MGQQSGVPVVSQAGSASRWVGAGRAAEHIFSLFVGQLHGCTGLCFESSPSSGCETEGMIGGLWLCNRNRR